MVNRSLALMMAAVFAIAGSVAHAKVSPALDMRRQSTAQQLQKLIDDVPHRGSCKPEKVGASDSIVGTAAWSSSTSNIFEGKCLLPVPKPDPFENIAHTVETNLPAPSHR